jgi:curved DNA-binding protein
MKFKDYYQTLGVAREASADEIKQAYRKLARKYHPDVSKEADAEARFKELGEAYEVLKDPEKRAAYDAIGRRAGGEDFQPPPGWDAGYEFHGSGSGGEDFDPRQFSDFFESLFGRRSARGGGARRGAGAGPVNLRGEDHHAKVLVDLEDAYAGARRSLTLRMPAFDEQGHGVLQERTLDLSIPRGIRQGQHLRLAGQGGPGLGKGPAGDLFLEIEFKPHPRFRVDGRDVYVDLPLAPWEAALGAGVAVPMPDGEVELTIPPGSAAGRKLRLKGRGIPGDPPGDLYAVLGIVLPPARGDSERRAYEALKAAAGADFNPRRAA